MGYGEIYPYLGDLIENNGAYCHIKGGTSDNPKE